jgi:glycosyltransferase involved in cell wall biosynthesis
MVLHMPWDRNLGGARVQLEIAEQLTALGHVVEKFDSVDALGPPPRSRIGRVFRPAFSARAVRYVQRQGHRFDVIDAHQGNLPCSKERLGFGGLLVARSVGLHAFYEDYRRLELERWPRRARGSLLGHWWRTWEQKRERSRCRRSLRHCDLINVPNRDEERYVREVLGLGPRCTVIPFGMSRARLTAFRDTALPAGPRRARKQVAFVGAWGLRKGAMDWGRIVRRLQHAVPGVRFLFLGTHSPAEQVLADLGQGPTDAVTVVPRYASEDLPLLLSDSTVGAFPSYIEGFGFGVLEMLAAGLPTVAYDVPGPREMIPLLDPQLLVPAGDTEAFCRRLEGLLTADPGHYAGLAEQSVEVASRFSWEAIARQTLTAYRTALDRLGCNRPVGRQPAVPVPG